MKTKTEEILPTKSKRGQVLQGIYTKKFYLCTQAPYGPIVSTCLDEGISYSQHGTLNSNHVTGYDGKELLSTGTLIFRVNKGILQPKTGIFIKD